MAGSSEYIYLSEIELQVLLASCGLDHWYGPVMDSPVELDNEDDLNRIIADMYRKDAIEWDGRGNAEISGIAGKAVEMIAAADTCIICYPGGADPEPFYAYPHDRMIASLDVSRNDINSVRLGIMPAVEWIDDLEEKGFFPEIIDDAPERITGGNLNEAMNDNSFIELRGNPDGTLLDRIITGDMGTYSILYHGIDEKAEMMLCTRDEYGGILFSWTEGGSK